MDLVLHNMTGIYTLFCQEDSIINLIRHTCSINVTRKVAQASRHRLSHVVAIAKVYLGGGRGADRLLRENVHRDKIRRNI